MRKDFAAKLIAEQAGQQTEMPLSQKEITRIAQAAANRLPVDTGRIIKMPMRAAPPYHTRPAQRAWTAMVAVACSLCLAVGAEAAGFTHWHERVLQLFHADAGTQAQMERTGAAQQIGEAVTDSGITITAIQVVQDSSCFYALFDVTPADPAQSISQDQSMEMSLHFSQEDAFDALEWGFSEEVSGANGRYFEIFGQKSPAASNQTLSASVDFTALQADGSKAAAGQNIITGNWSFSLPVTTVNARECKVDAAYKIDSFSVRIEKVSLSPISAVIYCNADDIRTLAAAEGISLEQADTLVQTDIVGLETANASLTIEPITLSEGFAEDGSYYKTMRLSHAIDLEQVSSVSLRGCSDAIPLS
jgi:hypothetical protein